MTKAKGGKKKKKGEGRGEKGGEQTAENPIPENALTDTRARLPQTPGTPRRHGRGGETASGATGHPGQELRAAAAAGGPASLSVSCSHGPGRRSRHGTRLLPSRGLHAHTPRTRGRSSSHGGVGSGSTLPARGAHVHFNTEMIAAPHAGRLRCHPDGVMSVFQRQVTPAQGRCRRDMITRPLASVPCTAGSVPAPSLSLRTLILSILLHTHTPS